MTGLGERDFNYIRKLNCLQNLFLILDERLSESPSHKLKDVYIILV